MGYRWAMAGSPSLNCTITTAISHWIWLFDPINNGYSPTMSYGFLGNMKTWGTSAMVEISWFNPNDSWSNQRVKPRSSMVLWGHHHGGPMPRPSCPRRWEMGWNRRKRWFHPTTWQAVVPCNVPLRTNPSTVPCADWFGSSADHGDWGCHKSQTLTLR